MNRRRIEVFRDFVMNLATLSKCKDKGVAAIITDKDGTQVYSIGINGGPRHGLDCLCALGGKYTCVHAEANALAKCTVADPEKVFFCSLSPCVTCASLIVNSGASAVYYVDSYKDESGLEVLANAGIMVRCIERERLLVEDHLDKLRLGHSLQFDLSDPDQQAAFHKLTLEATTLGSQFTCTYRAFSPAGPKEVVIRMVNHNG